MRAHRIDGGGDLLHAADPGTARDGFLGAGAGIRQDAVRRLAEKDIPNCAGFSSGFKARGRRIVNYVTIIATPKLDDKDKQVSIFFELYAKVILHP